MAVEKRTRSGLVATLGRPGIRLQPSEDVY